MKRSVRIALSILVVAVLSLERARRLRSRRARSEVPHDRRPELHRPQQLDPQRRERQPRGRVRLADSPRYRGREPRRPSERDGSFIAAIRFPDGSKIAQFSLIANDADADFNSAAYLIQKRVTDNLSPAKGGYNTVLEAHTKGAVTDSLRTFSDTPKNPISVDNARNMYYVELVSCAKTVEPFAVRAAYTT